MRYSLFIILIFIVLIQSANAQLSTVDLTSQIRKYSAYSSAPEISEYLATTSFNSGFDISFCLNEDITITTGLRYFSIEYSIIFNNPSWPPQHNGNGVFNPTIPGSQLYISPVSTMGLEIPFLLGIKPIKIFPRLKFSGGVLLSYSLSNDDYSGIIAIVGGANREPPHPKDTSNKFIQMLSTSIEYGIPINERISINPFLEFNWQALSSETANQFTIGERKYSYGFGFKFQYHLDNCYDDMEDNLK